MTNVTTRGNKGYVAAGGVYAIRCLNTMMASSLDDAVSAVYSYSTRRPLVDNAGSVNNSAVTGGCDCCDWFVAIECGLDYQG